MSFTSTTGLALGGRREREERTNGETTVWKFQLIPFFLGVSTNPGGFPSHKPLPHSFLFAQGLTSKDRSMHCNGPFFFSNLGSLNSILPPLNRETMRERYSYPERHFFASHSQQDFVVPYPETDFLHLFQNKLFLSGLLYFIQNIISIHLILNIRKYVNSSVKLVLIVITAVITKKRIKVSILESAATQRTKF